MGRKRSRKRGSKRAQKKQMPFWLQVKKGLIPEEGESKRKQKQRQQYQSSYKQKKKKSKRWLDIIEANRRVEIATLEQTHPEEIQIEIDGVTLYEVNLCLNEE